MARLVGERRSILVVDDEPDLASTLGDFLKQAIAGVKIHSAASGPQGLAVLQSQRIDLIMTDYRMPGMNGLQFLQEATAVAPHVPRILLTAYPEMRLALLALQEQQVVHFFRKPCDPLEVQAVVKAILDKSFTPTQRAEAFRRSLELSRVAPPHGR